MRRPVPLASASLEEKLADAQAHLDELLEDCGSDQGEIDEAEAKVRDVQRRMAAGRVRASRRLLEEAAS
jgi:peptidoglycan hydrolase CwlO-like protein